MGWNCPKWMGRLSSLLLSTPTPHGTKSTRSFSVFSLLLCDWNVKKSSLDSYNCVFSAAAFQWWCPEVARSPSRRLTTSGNGKKRALISYSMMRGGRCRRACWLQTRYLIYSSTAKSRDKKPGGDISPLRSIRPSHIPPLGSIPCAACLPQSQHLMYMKTAHIYLILTYYIAR